MRKIIHIDMDCFYAAIEMRDDPSLRTIPVAVGGPSNQRGVISTANYVARNYGVRSAMATARALDLCPQLTILSGRMSYYKEISQQIRAIFKRYTPIVEPLSLDEAYLDVTDSPYYRGSATLLAKHIRQDIFNELQLTASAGIAPLKFLAKIAADFNKPNGQYVITPEQIPDFLRYLPLEKLPGVGKVTRMRLQKLGLMTCGDVQNYDRIKLVEELGKFGQVLWDRCHGIDQRGVNIERVRKSVSVETTLEKDMYHWQECLPVLEGLYFELEKRLRREQNTSTIARQGVKLKFHDFKQTTQEHVWPVLDKQDLVGLAQQMWYERRKERGVRLVGLQVTLCQPQLNHQFALPW